MQQNRDGELKLLKVFGRFSSVLLLSFLTLNAGSFEEFKRTQNESFKKYKDERDTAFNNYLKEQWKAYKEFAGEKIYEKPKPKTVPKTAFVTPPSLGPKIIIKVKPPTPAAQELPKKIITVKPEAEEVVIPVVVKKAEEPTREITFNFYGSTVGFDIPEGIKKARFSPKAQEGVAAFFDAAASSDYAKLIRDIKEVKERLNLNDWGIYLLVNDIASKVYATADEATLFSWFIFNKLGYAVKVGIADKHVVMLTYSKKTIYSTPNYTFDNKKYYALSFYNKKGAGRLFTYNQDYPDATKAMDLAIVKLPDFEENKKSKVLKFSYEGKEYRVNFDYNKNIIDFMASYPQADYDTYFDAPVESESYNQIASALKPYLDGMRASDAMNFVLSFVQHAFLYQTDPDQFGREKPMFAEETLYYDKSDCEDRAVLYAYLMRKLFHVNVIGIKYKDHMATAIQVPMQGDAVNVQNRRYVIADPTYINATIGQSMPQYKSVIPETFIKVNVN